MGNFFANDVKIPIFFIKLQKFLSGNVHCPEIYFTMHFQRTAVYSKHRVQDTVQT